MSPVDYHAWTHRPKSQGGTDPIEIPSGIGPWAMLTDGFAECNDATTYPVGGQYYGTDDVVEDYYSFNLRNTTYPGSGSTDYYTLYVSQKGLYLLDAMGAWSWAAGNPGIGTFDLDPNLEAEAPFGFQTGENDGWIDEHVVEDTEFAALNPYGAIQRVTGIASLRAGTEFFPKIRQESGTSTLVFAFNYFKIIRLVDYPALSELRSASVFD
jgi:hypothetical protein